MDFFQRQDDSRSRSFRFFLAFSLAVLLAVIALYFIVTGSFLIVGYFSPIKALPGAGDLERLYASALPHIIYGNPSKVFSLRSFFCLSSLLVLFILALSMFKTGQIRRGGGAFIAELLGGRKLTAARTLEERRLLNMTLELALAANLPQPRIYILESERSINALTSGLNHHDAVLILTRGALDHLTRDEIQALAAHEFGHILNNDYRLNMVMAGWLYGLLFFYIQGRDMVRLGSDWFLDLIKEITDKETEGTSFLVLAPKGFIGLNMALMGLVLCLGGWVGKLGAELTQAAFSRQREYLADIFAVQFTRQPQALAEVLKKIIGSTLGEANNNTNAQTEDQDNSDKVSFSAKLTFSIKNFFGVLDGSGLSNAKSLLLCPFFFTSPDSLKRLWESHPPLIKRIEALDPAWDGTVPVVVLSRPRKSGPKKLTYAELVSGKRCAGESKNRPLPKNTGFKAPASAMNEKIFFENLMENSLALEESWASVLTLSFLNSFDQANNAYPGFFWGKALEKARRLYERIPAILKNAANDPTEAEALIAAVFINGEPQVMKKQKEITAQGLPPEMAAKAEQFYGLLSPDSRLSLLARAAATLNNHHDLDGRRRLTNLVPALVAADRRYDLFELAACQILKRELSLPLGSNDNGLVAWVKNKTHPVSEDVSLVLSALAHFGGKSDLQARAAYGAGVMYWPANPRLPSFLPGSMISSVRLEEALERLAEAPLQVRNALIKASLVIVVYDKEVNPREHELLRALASVLGIAFPILFVDS